MHILPSEKMRAENQFRVWVRGSIPGSDCGIFNFLGWLAETPEGQTIVKKLLQKEITP